MSILDSRYYSNAIEEEMAKREIYPLDIVPERQKLNFPPPIKLKLLHF